MASSSSSPSSSSVDQNPWFSVRRAFRNLQQQHFSGPHRKKQISQKKSPEIRGPRCPDPFRSNDQISNTVSCSQSESIDPSTIETCVECPLCMQSLPNESLPSLLTCHHRSCVTCLKIYLRIEITEGRVGIACPVCPEMLHPADICRIIEDDVLMQKYEDFMVRHVLVLDPDARWCPAPDCGYAVIATGHASCPKLECARPGCGTFFCYNCKQNWHPDQTCDAARAERSAIYPSLYPDASKERGSQSVIKACPRCGSLIMKLEDGSCNHMTCAGCGAEFCWLCLREISDLHYLSPSGCTFWGKKPWSHKRKILWQLGMLVGAPVGISLIAGVAFPVIIIGLPILVARKLMAKCRHMAKRKRHLVVASGVIASTLVSPVLAAVAVGVGVPMLLAYVYGVVPVSLCRDSCCTGRSRKSASSVVEFDLKEVPSVSAIVNAEHDSSSSSSAPAAAAAAATVSCSADADDAFHSSPSSVNSTCQPSAASMSIIEVKAEVSHDLVRHKGELSDQLKKNSRGSEFVYSATPALSSASSTITKTEAQGGISSVDRDLNKNSLDVVSLSDTSLNTSLPGATSVFSATTRVADCGAGTSTSNESVHPRLLLRRRSNKAFAVSAHSPPCGSSSSTATSHVKSFKRQSMSVGDSIDEKVEAECGGYLSLHSLAEEDVCLESFTGGSDIVTMVAVSEELSDMHCNVRPVKCPAAVIVVEPKANATNELKKLADASAGIAEMKSLQTMTELIHLPRKEASLECNGSLEIRRIKECDKHL